MISNGDGFCDNEWHMIKIVREGTRVILQVDNDEPATSNSSNAKSYFNFFFKSQKILISQACLMMTVP